MDYTLLTSDERCRRLRERLLRYEILHFEATTDLQMLQATELSSPKIEQYKKQIEDYTQCVTLVKEALMTHTPSE